MRRPGIFSIVLVLGMVIAGAALVRIVTSPEGGTAADVSDSQLLVTVRVPRSTTTTVGAGEVASPAASVPEWKPIAVPRDPYAREPIREIGTIEIPKIGLSHAMFHGVTLNNIDKGPSLWPGTATPGSVGNAVVAGHRVTRTHPFRNIHQLVPGDRVIFTVQGRRSEYQVTGSEVVSPKALEIAAQTGEATATLFACHPPGSARQRYVVHLELVRS